MYQFSYADTLEDSASQQRENERMALKRSIVLMQEAQEAGLKSRETIDAVHFNRRLWAILIEDLAGPNNDLPPSLRADLISIGLWIIREGEAIRKGEQDEFTEIIGVSRLVLEGLQ